MNKIDLGQTITILANIGVIAGIVFLGVEMRQNTTAIEVGAYQDLTSQVTSIVALSVENPRAYTLIDGPVPFSDMGPEDRRSAYSLAMLIFHHGDMAYHHYERGLISEELLKSALGIVTGNACNPKFQQTWSGMRDIFVSSYRSHVDGIMDQC